MHHPTASLAALLALSLGLVVHATACSREPTDAGTPAPKSTEPTKDAEAKAVTTPPPTPTPTPTPAPTPGTTTTPPPSPATDAAAAPAAQPPKLDAPVAPTPTTIFVAGEGGVKEVGLDGTVIRTLVDRPGRSPRWLPGKRELVFLRTNEHTGVAMELRAVTVADGAERVVASLPLRPPCSKKAYAAAGVEAPVLDLRNESELYVTRKGDVVCMTASDHEADLRTVNVAIAIRVADGKVDAALSTSVDECERPSEEPPAACEPDADDDSPAEEPEAPELVSPFAGTMVESRSPNGQWLLVELRSALGDVLHRQLVLYDTRTKQTYPLPRDGKGEWPAPMESVPPRSEGEDEEMIPGLPEVGGSEAMVWVGDHHLVVGRTLFVAGERIVALPGDVAL